MPSAVRLSDALDQYLAAIEAQGASKSTIKGKRSSLVRFLAVVGNIYPRNLTPHHVDAWLIEHQQQWQASTKKVQLTNLSAFQDWMQARKYMDRGMDLLEGRRRVRVPKKSYARIKADDFDRVLDGAPVPRDRVILALGLYLLVRVSEMTQIRWSDVDLAEGHVDIYRVKTKEPDRLPISPKLHAELVRWRAELCGELRMREPEPHWFVACAMKRAVERDEGGRYLGNKGEPIMLMPEQPLQHPLRRIKSILIDEGVEGNGIGMHTLRRSGAEALLDLLERKMGTESAIRVVQSMLGHKSIVTTEIYLDRDANKARRDELIRGLVYDGSLDGADLLGELDGAETSVGL